jgi:hypothetical protein
MGHISELVIIFQPFECPLASHASCCFRDPVKCLSHIGSLISCHSLLRLFLCFSNLFKPGISLFFGRFNLTGRQPGAMEFVNSSAASLTSTQELIFIPGNIKLDTRF